MALLRSLSLDEKQCGFPKEEADVEDSSAVGELRCKGVGEAAMDKEEGRADEDKLGLCQELLAGMQLDAGGQPTAALQEEDEGVFFPDQIGEYSSWLI